MNRVLVVKELAAENLISAFLWYEKQRFSLGNEFLEEWEVLAEYLSLHAESCEIKYKEFRMAHLKRFPYVVIYEIEGEMVIVYNVINTKRHPSMRYKIKRK